MEHILEHDWVITSVCRRYFEQKQDAEDAAQECRVKAWSRYQQFAGKSKFSTWLYAVARSCCREILRARRSRLSPLSLDELREASKFDVRSTDTAADVSLCAKQRANKLKTNRPEEYELRELIEIYGYTAEELAVKLRMTVPAVKSRLFRASVALREDMAGIRQKKKCPVMKAYVPQPERHVAVTSKAHSQKKVKSYIKERIWGKQLTNEVKSEENSK